MLLVDEPTLSSTQMSPDMPEPNLLQQATAHASAGDFEQAIIDLKALLEIDPAHEIGQGMLGAIYAQLNMRERAMACFRRVLEKNPSNALARLHLGLLQLSSAQLDEAIETFQASLGSPGDYLVHFHSGLALLQLQKPAQARKLLENAAQRMPKGHALYPQLQTLLHHLNRYH
jgi:tetratricopeptide (TPR) repeat protein